MADLVDPVLDALTARLDGVAAGPASASGDAGSVTEQPIGPMIEYLKFRAAQRAAGSPTFGIRMRQVRHPGTA
jgi:hypothetical protein